MSHQLFEPEMGLSAHFQQKRPKRPKKNFRQREENSISCPGTGKWNFPPALINKRGTGNGFFLPLSEKCLFFFSLYENFVLACFVFVGPLLVFVGLCWSFLAFFGLFWPLRLFLLVKHSLDVGITSKMEESHILHVKKIPPWIFFSPQTEVYPRASLPPLGLNYSPRFARA